MLRNFAGMGAGAGVAMALLLAGCGQEAPVIDDGNTAARAAVASLAPDASQEALCGSIAGASTGGDASMQGALASDPDGAEYGGGVIRQIVEQRGYRFTRAEMLGGHCWAYARAAATVFDRVFDLQWRCPVMVVSDDRRRTGKTVLEEVDAARCDFGAAPGTPTRREVTETMERIAI